MEALLPRRKGTDGRGARLCQRLAAATGREVGAPEARKISSSVERAKIGRSGWRRFGRCFIDCLIWRQTSSYARSSGLERSGYAVHPSLATGAILCRPRARAGEVWLCCAPQSGDWGYPMPPASAGWRGLVVPCTPVWRLGLSYAARERGLERFRYAVHPSLATGAILCRPRARAESPSRLPRLTEPFCNSLYLRRPSVWKGRPVSGDCIGSASVFGAIDTPSADAGATESFQPSSTISASSPLRSFRSASMWTVRLSPGT